MKIAILSREYPPHGLLWGSALFYHNLAVVLNKRGHEVHVICQARGKPKDFIDQEGVFIHEVGTTSKRGSALGRIDFSIYAWLKLRKLTKKHKIQILDAPFFFAEGFLASLWKQVPIVVQANAFAKVLIKTKSFGGTGELAKLKIASYLESLTANRADRIVANSQVTYRELKETFHVSSERIDLVWENRIDLEKFRFVKSDIRERLRIPYEVPLILYVGRRQARKGIHILCQAIPEILRSVPSSKFVFVGGDTNSAPGGGYFKPYILERANEQGFSANVLFFDFLPEDELIQLYSTCDVFVFPSLYETFGWPVLEAMACGKPVVATATGIAAELEPDGQGLLVVPPGDSKRLAEGVVRLLSLSSVERDEVARRNRQFVEDNFSPSAFVDNMLAVYARALEGSHR